MLSQMLTFSQSYPPSAQAYLESQFSLLSEWSEQMCNSAQKINELNIQTMQTLMRESVENFRQMLEAGNPYEALSIAMNQLHPAAEKLQAYQGHLANIAAGARIDLAKAAQAHAPQTSRAASAMTDEVTRRVSEQTQKAAQRQKESMEKLASQTYRTPESGRGRGTSVH